MSRIPSRAHRSATGALLLGAVLLAAGCGSKPVRETPVESVPATPAGNVATATPAGPAPRADLSAEERSAREALEREGMVIHFDFDSSQVKPEYFNLVAAHARFAIRFGEVTLRLEGHSDDRGTREYNIGLAERRAQAVRRALELQGVPVARISTVSYGEERPVATGSNEQAYAQNRRVEIRYAP